MENGKWKIMQNTVGQALPDNFLYLIVYFS